ncbi:hypothetical protein GTX14_24935 [Streptomyces sp. SID4944]|nr:hypothetical protein [Streptomyces sp. SID4944]
MPRPGKLHITRLAPDNTREMRTVPCGQTALTYLTNEGSLRTVLIQAANKEAWASWALLRPTSKPDTAILRTRLVPSASPSG